MVGGHVIEVRQIGGKTRLWVMDKVPFESLSSPDEVMIYVETEGEVPVPGDAVWWQARYAYWTPKDRRFEERRLRRIGYSFQPQG